MAYNVEKAIDDFGGKAELLSLLSNKGFNQVELHKLLKLSNSDKRLGANIYKRIYKYLGIEGLPYANLRSEVKTLMLQLDKHLPNYWESDYIVTYLINKLNNPTLNIADNRIRAVINFPRHPKSNKDSNQVKAHVISWELHHKQYVPDNHWVIPIDDDYLNLDPTNLELVNTTEYKSSRFSGEGNPSYLHGQSRRPKLGGWFKTAYDYRIENCECKLCGSKEQSDLVVHHIINYRLFNNPIDAHSRDNLITLCNVCHPLVHYHKLSIVQVLISEMRYSKLIELLETLKSQVPDTLMETYRDVEKQLGLTDNQQPSTV